MTLSRRSIPVTAIAHALSAPYVPEANVTQKRLVAFYPEFDGLNAQDVSLLMFQRQINDPLFVFAWRTLDRCGLPTHVPSCLRKEAVKLEALARLFDHENDAPALVGPPTRPDVERRQFFEDDLLAGRVMLDARISVHSRIFAMEIFVSGEARPDGFKPQPVYLNENASWRLTQRLNDISERLTGEDGEAARQTLLRSFYLAMA